MWQQIHRFFIFCKFMFDDNGWWWMCPVFQCFAVSFFVILEITLFAFVPTTFVSFFNLIEGQGFPRNQQVIMESNVKSGLRRFDRMGSRSGHSSNWCTFCSKAFSSASSLRRHRELFHTDKKLPSCSICGKKCSNLYSLGIHVRSHTDVRQFVCPTCSKSYKHKKDLKRHRCFVLEQKSWNLTFVWVLCNICLLFDFYIWQYWNFDFISICTT